jgi:hypothetical protein
MTCLQIALMSFFFDKKMEVKPSNFINLQGLHYSRDCDFLITDLYCPNTTLKIEKLN